jgi:hypothetical protein
MARFVDDEAVAGVVARRKGRGRKRKAPGAVVLKDGHVRSRGFVLTVHLAGQPDLKMAEEIIRGIGTSYYIFGRELTEDGRPHLQTYVYFKNQRTKQGVYDKFWPYKPWIDVARGDALANFDYCGKDASKVAPGDWEEGGVRPLNSLDKGEKEKDRWASTRLLAIAGDLASIDDEHAIKYNAALRSIASEASRSRVVPSLDVLRNIWIGGPPGIGKSATWELLFGSENIYEKDASIWWDGYAGQDIVIFSDWQPADFAKYISMVKNVADKRAVLVQVKGEYKKIRPKHIIVSSNFTMAECFKGANFDQYSGPLNWRFEELNLFRCYAPGECVCRVHGKVAAPWVVTEAMIRDKVKEWPLYESLNQAASASPTFVSQEDGVEVLARVASNVSSPVVTRQHIWCRVGNTETWSCPLCHISVEMLGIDVADGGVFADIAIKHPCHTE